MLSQAAMESLYSATYMEDYLDGMENLPDDVQRKVSQILELNVTLRTLLGELESNMSYLMENMGKVDTRVTEDKSKKKMFKRIQQILMTTQDIGDEKLQLGQQILDLMENKVQQLNLDNKNIDLEKKAPETVETVRETKPPEFEERAVKRARRARHEVFVPSILGPATLEATSFSQISDVPSATVSSALSSLPLKSQSITSRQTSPIRISSYVKKEDTDTISSPRQNKNEIPYTPVAAAIPDPVPATSRTAVTSSKVAQNVESRSYLDDYDEVVKGYIAAASTDPSLSKLAIKPVLASSKAGSTVPIKTEVDSSQPESSTAHAVAVRPDFEWKKSCTKSKKEKRGKKRRSSTKQPVNIPIDPDEPLYCLCDQVSYGEMIGCDNDLCPIEWFHFSCVSLTTKPKGKWFCPKCRGDRPNVMKPKAIFLKELAIYNRQKEESN